MSAGGGLGSSPVPPVGTLMEAREPETGSPQGAFPTHRPPLQSQVHREEGFASGREATDRKLEATVASGPT